MSKDSGDKVAKDDSSQATAIMTEMRRLFEVPPERGSHRMALIA